MTEEAPTLEALESESVADTLASVMDDAGMETTDPMFDTVKETLETSETVEQPETVEDGRARDESGRFVSTKEEQEAEPSEATESENTDDLSTKAEPAEKPTPLEPPAEWSAEQHEVFHALDDKAKDFVLSRVTEADTKAQESQQIAEKYSGIESIIAEHRTAWAAKGLDDTGAIRALAALSASADANPPEFIKWFAEGRGINLAELAGTPAQEAEDSDLDPYADPEVIAVKQQNQRLEQELNQIKGYLEQQKNQQTSVSEEQFATEIQNFQNATSDTGEKLHPYFNQVEDLMADLITSAHRKGQELTLEKAYQSACRADDDISAKIEAARKARDANGQAVKRREKSMAATRAGSSVSGRPAPSEQHTSDSLADQLRSEFDSRGLLDQPLI